MLKQTKYTVTSNETTTSNQRVVKEVVETRTTADGTVITTTKRITTVGSDDTDPSFKEVDIKNSSYRHEKTLDNTLALNSKDVKDSCEKKEKKSLAERFGLKSKPKQSKDNEKHLNETNVTDLVEFEKESLKSHNDYRKKHGVPPLAISKELCVYSQEWADHLAATRTFKHRSERKYGENIYTKWSSNPNHIVKGHEAVDSWYSEIKDHVFEKEPTSLKSGHFTQVIWKESKFLGVAISRTSDGHVYVVSNYDPPGNFIGKFAENVPAIKK